MTAYYNEFDPKAAAWLRELIKVGLIAPGEVDERSIEDVGPDELKEFTQCHFFAGIGGWSYALRLAGWPDDRPVWTGSPPCQPFSNAGKQKAQADARHLWPVFFNLIRECKPANIFGEQVEAAIRTGWLDDLQDGLETEGYATGKIVLPACGVGGYHIRQRIWFVAERMADTKLERRETEVQQSRLQRPEIDREKADVAGSDGTSSSRVADADSTRWEPRQRHDQATGHGHTVAAEGYDGRPKPTDASQTFWSNPDWLYCRDGKWRPVESGTFPLADGLSERVVRLRGYGNAIVPQVAAEFIKAFIGDKHGNQD